MAWIIRGRDSLFSNVAESAKELWMLFAPNLQVADSCFWNSAIFDPSHLLVGCSLQSKLWILKMLNVSNEGDTLYLSAQSA